MSFIVLFTTTTKEKSNSLSRHFYIPVCEIFFDACIITKSSLAKYRTGKVFSWNKINKLLNKLSNTVKLLVKKTPWLNLVSL